MYNAVMIFRFRRLVPPEGETPGWGTGRFSAALMSRRDNG